jgi:hypothetical protein
MTEGVDDLLQPGQRRRVLAGWPSSWTAVASSAGFRAARRSPSRSEQLIPAPRMNVARLSGCGRNHAARSSAARGVSSRGGPVPPDSDRTSGVVTIFRAGSLPPVMTPVPAIWAAASSRWW